MECIFYIRSSLLSLEAKVQESSTAIPKPFEESTLEEMDRVIDINIRGNRSASSRVGLLRTHHS
jgi:hypothetical protein